MYYRKKVLFYCILAIGLSIVFIIMLGFFEFRGRRAWQAKISLVSDIDHRMEPNTGDRNSDGIRCNKEPNTFAPEHLNIIFLGDSFVNGRKVPAKYAFPQRFERMANAYCNPELTVNVANFGWTSSSPYLSFRLLKDIASKYNPDIVFLCIDMTDFFDDLKYQSLIERPKTIFKMISWLPGSFFTLQDALYQLTRHNSLEGLYEILFGLPNDRFFIVNKPLEQTRKYCKYIVTNINRTNEFVTMTLGARFILVILPRSFQYSDQECPDNWEADQYEVFGPLVYEPFKFFDELKERVNYPIFSILNDFQSTTVFPTCFPNDPHWNAYGHGVAARSIFALAQKKKILRCSISKDKDNSPTIPNADPKDTAAKGIRNANTKALEHYWLESEDAEIIVHPFVVAHDKNASEKKYIYSPNGTGNQYTPGPIMVSYKINISQTGQYVLWGRVKVSTVKDNSFFVQVNDDLDNLWDIELGNYWHWDKVNDRDSDDPAYFILTEGSHTIKIKLREDGTKLDTMLLTKDLSLVPSSVEKLYKSHAILKMMGGIIN